MKELHRNKEDSIQFLSTTENFKVGHRRCASRPMVTQGNGQHNTVLSSLISHRACCHTCYTIQLMHYSHCKTHSLQHLKPIKC